MSTMTANQSHPKNVASDDANQSVDNGNLHNIRFAGVYYTVPVGHLPCQPAELSIIFNRNPDAVQHYPLSYIGVYEDYRAIPLMLPFKPNDPFSGACRRRYIFGNRSPIQLKSIANSILATDLFVPFCMSGTRRPSRLEGGTRSSIVTVPVFPPLFPPIHTPQASKAFPTTPVGEFKHPQNTAPQFKPLGCFPSLQPLPRQIRRVSPTQLIRNLAYHLSDDDVSNSPYANNYCAFYESDTHFGCSWEDRHRVMALHADPCFVELPMVTSEGHPHPIINTTNEYSNVGTVLGKKEIPLVMWSQILSFAERDRSTVASVCSVSKWFRELYLRQLLGRPLVLRMPTGLITGKKHEVPSWPVFDDSLCTGDYRLLLLVPERLSVEFDYFEVELNILNCRCEMRHTGTRPVSVEHIDLYTSEEDALRESRLATCGTEHNWPPVYRVAKAKERSAHSERLYGDPARNCSVERGIAVWDDAPRMTIWKGAEYLDIRHDMVHFSPHKPLVRITGVCRNAIQRSQVATIKRSSQEWLLKSAWRAMPSPCSSKPAEQWCYVNTDSLSPSLSMPMLIIESDEWLQKLG